MYKLFCSGANGEAGEESAEGQVQQACYDDEEQFHWGFEPIRLREREREKKAEQADAAHHKLAEQSYQQQEHVEQEAAISLYQYVLKTLLQWT